MNLSLEIQRLLPKAIEWAQQQERVAKYRGSPLSEDLISVARDVGVQQPEKVRIVALDSLPHPDDPSLRAAANTMGLLGPTMMGLTLGYAIFVLREHNTVRLLSHELRHVHQYEQSGGIAEFLPVYISEILYYGYQQSPLEIDARSHEVTTW